MMMLLKALTAFFILVYIHISYSQTPATCLEYLKTEGWPRDGILRVEILRNGEKLVPIKDGVEDMSEELTMPRSNHKEGLISIDPSATLPHEENEAKKGLTLEIESTLMEGANVSLLENSEITERLSINESNDVKIEVSDIVVSTTKSDAVFNSETIQLTDTDLSTKETYINETIAKINDQQFEEILKTDVPEVEKLMNAVMPDDQYVVECKVFVIFN